MEATYQPSKRSIHTADSYRTSFFNVISSLDESFSDKNDKRNAWWDEAVAKFAHIERTNTFLMAVAFLVRDKKLKDKKSIAAALQPFVSHYHKETQDHSKNVSIIVLDMYRYYRAITL